MLNQVVLVGRIVRDLELKETDKSKLANLTLAVPRSYKNINGEYDTDYINCTLWKGIAENTAEYCNKGDLIAVRGRLQSNVYEKDGLVHITHTPPYFAATAMRLFMRGFGT